MSERTKESDVTSESERARAREREQERESKKDRKKEAQRPLYVLLTCALG